MALFHSSTQNVEHRRIGGTKFVPFKVYVEIFPTLANGRRVKYVRDLQKIAQFVEEDLQDSDFNIALPVAYTPQFAQSPPRITIDGYDDFSGQSVSNDPPVDQSTQPTIIHSGTIPGERTEAQIKPPSGGDLSRGQDPTVTTDSRVSDLKTSIESVLTAALGTGAFRIFFIEYNGVKYGSLPPKKAFRSFP